MKTVSRFVVIVGVLLIGRIGLSAQSIAAVPYCSSASNCSSMWSSLVSAAPTVGLTILNDSCGLGSSADSGYQTQLSNARSAGIQVVAYVPTHWGYHGGPSNSACPSVNYGTLCEVKTLIDNAYSFYPSIDGIFLDEVPGESSLTVKDSTNTPVPYQWIDSSGCHTDSGQTMTYLQYYSSLYSYIKTKSGLVVLNSGAHTDTLLSSPNCSSGLMSASDIVVNYEGYLSTYLYGGSGGTPVFTASGWEQACDPSRFWHIVYKASSTDVSADEMNYAVQISKNNNIGWVYVTNWYDSLPASWSSETRKVQPLYNWSAYNDAYNVYYQFSYNDAVSSAAYLRVFIEIDGRTGYSVSGLGSTGAIYMIENDQLYQHTGGSTDWTWIWTSSVTKSISGKTVSWTVPRSTLGTAGTGYQQNTLVFNIEFSDSYSALSPSYVETYSQ